jgi:hypothetical protein
MYGNSVFLVGTEIINNKEYVITQQLNNLTII